MQAAAESDIVAANLTVGVITTTFNAAPVGQVISQSPVAGTSVIFDTPVDIVVSAGSNDTLVPDLTNTSITVIAPGLLAAVGLVLGTITYMTSGTIIAGNVISQSPTAGNDVAVGSAVSVVVSSGLPGIRVPDLFGMTQASAITLLLSLGLVPGAIGSAPSKFVPPGEVQTQNPSAGAPVAAGTIVSFVLSLGTPAVGEMFDFEATVISQYANSPTIMQLCNNLNQYIDQSANFANFYNFVWNVDTAVGFGLDIWGVIVGVSRLLQIPNTTAYVGFDIKTESQPAQDWTPAGSSAAPYNNPPVGGAFYTGHNATEAYLLPDDAYRQLILAKAFANICTTTAPAINQILQNLYGTGTAWVLNTGPMGISYNLSFTPTAIQLAILEQSGVIPTPPGVSVVINTNV
jgi:beta-lactam-binding protein with PASTA domain